MFNCAPPDSRVQRPSLSEAHFKEAAVPAYLSTGPAFHGPFHPCISPLTIPASFRAVEAPGRLSCWDLGEIQFSCHKAYLSLSTFKALPWWMESPDRPHVKLLLSTLLHGPYEDSRLGMTYLDAWQQGAT